MSDKVNEHREKMAKEVSDMQSAKIFDKKEAEKILKARTELLYKLNNAYAKNVDDYLNFVRHDAIILGHIYRIREKRKISAYKQTIDHSILKRIKNFYDEALQRFPKHYDLHMEYFSFCKLFLSTEATTSLTQTLIKHFPEKPETWQLVADWHRRTCDDYPTALKLLHKGVTLHKKCQNLYSETIETELAFVSEIKKKAQSSGNEESNIEEKEKHCCEKIKTYLSVIFENLFEENQDDNAKNITFYLRLLSLVEQYSFLTEAQNMIVDYLYKNFRYSGLVWNMLARRETRGYHYNTSGLEEMDTDAAKSCEQNCVDKYQQGLAIVTGSERTELCSNYLQYLMESRNAQSKASKDLSESLLMRSFQEAAEHGYLSEDLCVTYLGMLNDDQKKGELRRATQMFPTSLQIWKHQLLFLLDNGEKKEADNMLKEAIFHLKHDGFDLLLMRVRYHLFTPNADHIISAFEDALQTFPEVANALKPRYIEWLVGNRGIDGARTKYKELAQRQPYCKELHLTMAKIESMEMRIQFADWKLVQEYAVNQFGNTDVDVWIGLLRVLLLEKAPRYQLEVQKVVKRAKRELPPLLKETFEDNYQALIASV